MGDRRINTCIELTEDIFSLAYTTCVKDEHICEHFDVVNGDFWEEDNEEEKE